MALVPRSVTELKHVLRGWNPEGGALAKHLDVMGVVETLRTLRARLILPMHYLDAFTLSLFLDRIRNDIPVEMGQEPTVVVSQATLPGDPKVLVLPGQ